MASKRIVAYKLYSTAAATTTNAANIQIPQSGAIIGVHWSGGGIAGAGATNYLQHELSLSSASQLQVSDSRDSVSSTVMGTNVASSTATTESFQAMPGIPVNAGDKLYLHALLTNNWTSTMLQCYVYIAH